ncbi:uncharacterized protein LOC115466337 [Microcaecilia unicolor]|uniref:Uncharacterized protein LOC115466337 n=1 Tax=Microcaecilia unicolor TaxID=1415580 RepID=A0A6P7XLJ2_9AMPH|nr:uncharacterized protein LOC115466337 [Microcaecilia unicolor]
MPAKSPQAVKDRISRTSPKMVADQFAAPVALMVTLQEEAVRKLTKQLTVVLDDRLSKLQASVDDICKNLERHDLWLKSISSQEDCAVTAEAHLAELESQCKTILQRIEDQENRGRRNNVALLPPLPESVKDQGLWDFLEKCLPYKLGLLSPDLSMKVERIHCIGSTKEGDTQPSEKEKLMQSSKASGLQRGSDFAFLGLFA